MNLRKVRKEDVSQIEQEEKKTFGKYAVESSTFLPLLELFGDGQWVYEDNAKIAAYIFTEKHNFSPPLTKNHNPEKTHVRDGIFFVSFKIKRRRCLPRKRYR